MQLGIRGHLVTEPLFSLFAEPGERLRISHNYDGLPMQLSLAGNPVGEREPLSWVLSAPDKPGLYPLVLRRLDNGDETRLNLFVKVPATQMEGEFLNGYRIGSYPAPRKSRSNYQRPTGFIEVTADNVDTQLSPHFTLRQFLCKQQSDYPKYVLIKEDLLVLLEGLLEDVNAAGYPAETFGIISGYRTPWYNKRIGNVPYSRHVYGDAMDIFIDVDGDGRMDDLDADGMQNTADISRFFQIVDSYKARPQNMLLAGGVGHYNKTSRHGGFVHVDTRGYRARW